MIRIIKIEAKIAAMDRAPDVRRLGAKLHIVDLLALVPSATTSAMHALK
ncbi:MULTISPECIES: hypothetical protein [Bradyrhizobium]|nr:MULTISPECIES: hypothetical protein [Bradyrhizobium]WLB48613.1 hypothetical protein QIH93_11730 [Bradyrhizobium ottawaense]WQN85932.1 hypothetical protein U7859_16685 [Bradyrhizobium ottawaense]